MSVYTEQKLKRGSVILKHGTIMTTDQILEELRYARIGQVACNNPELTGGFIIDSLEATEQMKNGDVEKYIRRKP